MHNFLVIVMVDGVSIIFAKRMSSYSKKLSQENNGDNKKNEVFDNMIQNKNVYDSFSGMKEFNIYSSMLWRNLKNFLVRGE